MANQVASANILASSSSTASGHVAWHCQASILGSSSFTASGMESVKLTAPPSTAGFAGITVDPTPYVYAAAQAILAAAATMGGTPQILIVDGVQPYVQLIGVNKTSMLPPQYMIGVITGATPPFPTLLQNLWVAVVKYLLVNPALLRQDGFLAAVSGRSDGAEVLDLIV